MHADVFPNNKMKSYGCICCGKQTGENKSEIELKVKLHEINCKKDKVLYLVFSSKMNTIFCFYTINKY